MEIIPQDAIDTIDDFIQHLSPEQFEEFVSQTMGSQKLLEVFINILY